MVSDDKQRGHAVDGDGSNKEGKDGKGNGDGKEGWRATKRAMAKATRAMATRVMGERRRRGRW